MSARGPGSPPLNPRDMVEVPSPPLRPKPQLLVPKRIYYAENMQIGSKSVIGNQMPKTMIFNADMRAVLEAYRSSSPFSRPQTPVARPRSQSPERCVSKPNLRIDVNSPAASPKGSPLIKFKSLVMK